MSLVRWAPFSAFTSVERQMKAMLDQLPGRGWLEGFDWKPDTDVFKEDDTLVIRAELPGIEADDIEVDVEGSVLHVKGEKKVEHEIEEDDRFLRECRYGAFRRDVMLPDGVDPKLVEATFENGVLMIRVPIPMEPEEPVAMQIEVKPLEVAKT